MSNILPFLPPAARRIDPDPYAALREAFAGFVARCDDDGWEIAGRDDEPDILSVELHHPARPGTCCTVFVTINEDLAP